MCLVKISIKFASKSIEPYREIRLEFKVTDFILFFEQLIYLLVL
jgi:hypothetical protein